MEDREIRRREICKDWEQGRISFYEKRRLLDELDVGRELPAWLRAISDEIEREQRLTTGLA